MKKRFRSRTTFYTYCISYALILFVSLTGMYLVVHFQLKNRVSSTFAEQTKTALTRQAELITTQFTDINQTSFAIQSDIDIIQSRYRSDGFIRYSAVRQLQKYISGNSLARDVLYLDAARQDVLSTSYLAQHDGSHITIRNGQEAYSLPVAELWEEPQSSYIRPLVGKSGTLYLYIPPQQSEKNRILYILNNSELHSLLNMSVSSGITAAALADEEGRLLYAVNGPALTQAIAQDAHSSRLYTAATDYNALRVVALFDPGYVEASVNEVFQKAYLGMAVIALLGILVSLAGIRITYTPLWRLIRSIMGDGRGYSDDLQSIREAFDDARSENVQLTEKIHEYQRMAQKSILDSIVSREAGQAPSALWDLDRFFDPSQHQCFLVAKLFFTPQHGQDALLRALREELSPLRGLCEPLEQEEDACSMLLSFPGAKEEGTAWAQALFTRLTQQYPCRAALSNITENPLEIARIYDNAQMAARHAGGSALTRFDDLGEPSGQPSPPYPYQHLDTLGALLQQMDFERTRGAIEQLFASIDPRRSPDFFVRCLFTDIITLIVTAMNRACLRFDRFSTVYFEALFLCRGQQDDSTKGQILDCAHRLVDIFAAELEASSLPPVQIEQYVQENCLSSSFSLAGLADHFQTSPAYMSFIFKKKLNKNLSDYVWELRLAKAQSILRATTIPIDQVSTMVGYDNAASFRRKFKDSLGITPSEYRRQVAG